MSMSMNPLEEEAVRLEALLAWAEHLLDVLSEEADAEGLADIRLACWRACESVGDALAEIRMLDLPDEAFEDAYEALGAVL